MRIVFNYTKGDLSLNVKTNQIWLRLAGIIIVILFSGISLFVGVQDLSLLDIFSLSDIQQTVLLTTRIPRTISLILSGATLSIAGLVMQQLTQNKFVSPTTAGTLSSTRFGVIMSMVLFSGATYFQRILFAFASATIGTLIFALFLRTVKQNKSIMVPLVGMMFGNIISSIGSYFALRYELVQNASSWLQGNFSLVTSDNFLLIFLSIPVLILIYMFAHYFTVMGLGREMAVELGISYNTIELIGIIIVALGTTSVLLTVGSIPFIGIIIPNLVSMKAGDNFRKVLFPTALFGSIFTIMCDILARTIIAPYELPISIVVGIVGSALFLFLILRGESSAA